MATLAEIEAAIRNADAAGRKDDVRALAAEYERLKAAEGGPKSRGIWENEPLPEGYEPGFFEQVGRTLNDVGGFLSDTQRVSADAVTRGLGDKASDFLFDGGAREATEQARENLPAAVEMPIDIASTLLTMPYKTATLPGAALAGAGEGAVSAYGHSDNWVPDRQDLANIALQGGAGGVLGLGGSALGILPGKVLAKKPAMFKDADDLFAAVPGAKRNTRAGKDIHRRAAQMERVDANQAKGPSAWAKESEEIDRFGRANTPWSRQQANVIHKMANPRDSKAVQGVDYLGTVAQGGNSFPGRAAVAYKTLGVGPTVGAGLKGGANIARGLQEDKLVNELRQMILSADNGAPYDPAVIAKARDALAKLGIGGSNARINER